ncbi:MAG: flagellin, partial [Campylobacterota bacterium]
GNSAVALTQIADKAMAEQSNILDVVKTKLVQAATATTSDEGRNAIRKDVSKLLSQLDNIAQQTNYNGTTLLQASSTLSAGASTGLTFQMGETSTDTIEGGSSVNANSDGLGLVALRDYGSGALTVSAAGSGMTLVDSALNLLNGWRADFGSTQNQLESAVRNQMTQQTNIKAAESVIRDVDYAQESANFNKQNIIAQAGTYAMSQSNATQQNVLRLLQ